MVFMSDQKISLSTAIKSPTGAELVPLAIANVGNYNTTLNTVRGIGIGKSMASAYTASISNPVSGMAFKLQRITRPISPFAGPLLQTFEDDMIQDAGHYTYTGNIGT